MAGIQRRKKTDNNNAKTTTTTSRTNTNKKSKEEQEHEQALIQELQKAHTAVEQTLAKLRGLHMEWHRYLYGVSILVILLSLHQAQTPIGSCIQDVKNFNKSVREVLSNEAFDDFSTPATISSNRLHRPIYTAWETVHLLFQTPRVIMGFLSVLMAFSLTYFLQLQDPYASFSHPRFLVTNTFAPSILMMYWTERKQNVTDPQASLCLSRYDIAFLKDDHLVDGAVQASIAPLSFPLILIFYVIFLLVGSFIRYQHGTQQRYLRKIEKLMQDFK